MSRKEVHRNSDKPLVINMVSRKALQEALIEEQTIGLTTGLVQLIQLITKVLISY